MKASQIIAYTAITVLCVTLLIVLFRMRRILDLVEVNLRQISAKAMPVLSNLEVITDRIRTVVESVGDQVDTLKETIISLRDVASNILAFEQRVQQQIEEPVMSAVESITSIFKGIQSFIERIPFVGRLRA